MKRNILYYPTIDIPNNNWLRNAVFYWDEVSSIVPMDYIGKPVIELSRDIESLRDEGFFRPISPTSFFQSHKAQKYIGDLEKEFLEIINGPEFRDHYNDKGEVFRIHKSKLRYNIHRSKVKRIPGYSVFNDKMSRHVMHSLADKGLIDPKSLDSEWILVEPETALLYMSLLAKYIAEFDEHPTVIGTDNHYYEHMNFSIKSGQDKIPCFSSNLNEVLPSPAPDVSFNKIIEFKKDRRDELIKIRTVISEYENSISNSESFAEVKDHMANFFDQIEIEVNKLKECCSDSKISTISKSLKSLINIKSPTAIASFAAIAGKTTEIAQLPTGYTMAGLFTVGGLELYHSYVNLRKERRAILRESSFSYLFHAERQGIIKTKFKTK